MKLKSLLFISFMTIWAVQCTGMNIMYTTGLRPNTNPTKDYAIGAMAAKGGYIFHDAVIPGQIGDNAEKVVTGRACSKSFLLASFGDSSIEAAKAEARITKVASIEYEQTAIFTVFFHKFCTIVTGSSESVETKTDTKSAAGKKK
ncbi:MULTISPECIES: adhesin Lsa14 [Leptospira]|uniref:adhesin Lsa14 n=1 Tax=Leptospira TaxID=171 RepID=UPI0002BFED21|nr:MULTISPECIES: TRL-like family protein [Leptospira]EMK12684.1 TRL-like family protein [Leptospira sp. serovar Kenya str. Sh9]